MCLYKDDYRSVDDLLHELHEHEMFGESGFLHEPDQQQLNRANICPVLAGVDGAVCRVLNGSKLPSIFVTERGLLARFYKHLAAKLAGKLARTLLILNPDVGDKKKKMTDYK